MGIEPTQLAWEARTLPLSNTRKAIQMDYSSIINESCRENLQERRSVAQ